MHLIFLLPAFICTRRHIDNVNCAKNISHTRYDDRVQLRHIRRSHCCSPWSAMVDGIEWKITDSIKFTWLSLNVCSCVDLWAKFCFYVVSQCTVGYAVSCPFHDCRRSVHSYSMHPIKFRSYVNTETITGIESYFPFSMNTEWTN